MCFLDDIHDTIVIVEASKKCVASSFLIYHILCCVQKLNNIPQIEATTNIKIRMNQEDTGKNDSRHTSRSLFENSEAIVITSNIFSRSLGLKAKQAK